MKNGEKYRRNQNVRNSSNNQGTGRSTDTSGKKDQRKSPKRRNKQVEVNVNDSDINAADLRPFDKRRSTSHDNDFSWYNHYPVLIQNASGVNYASSVGSKINWFDTINVINPVTSTYSAPGICTIKYIPTYGKLDGTVETPLSRVWAQLYSAMRIKLTSRADYDPTDTLMYIIAMDSAYTLYGLAAKAYGLTNNVSPFNLYLLRTMCIAAGYDYDSISKNRAAFRDLINQYAVALSKYMVPADLDIFKRHMWLTQNLFTDSSTAKAQLYNFRPEGIYILNELTQGDKVLKYEPLKGTASSTNLITFGDISNWIQSVLLALDNSQDIVQMSADIGKAWDNKTLAAALIPETYATPISYSQEVLSQIENLVLNGSPIHSTVDGQPNLNITVDLNLDSAMGPKLLQTIWMHPVVNISDGAPNLNEAINTKACNMALHRQGFLNFHWGNVSNEDTVIASRGISNIIRVGKPTGQTINCAQIGDCGSEVFTVAELYGFTSANLDRTNYTWAVTTAGQSALASVWSSFDWAPAYFAGISTTADDLTAYRMQDIDMYGVIDKGTIAMLHYSCILSLFYSDVYPESVVNMPSM